MEKVCGYKGLDGKFYKKEKDCEEADLEYKIKDVQIKLNNFYTTIQGYLFIKSDFDLNVEFSKNKGRLMEIISKAVLEHSDGFLEVIKQKKKLEKEFDQLQKTKANYWWLKYKWW